MSHEKDNKRRIIGLFLTLVFTIMVLVLWKWQTSAIAQIEPLETSGQANPAQSSSQTPYEHAAIVTSPEPVAPATASIAAVDAIPVQIRPGIEGIALIDKQNYTICIYQYQMHRPDHESLVLLAARSFRYDVLLEDFNTAEPKPSGSRCPPIPRPSHRRQSRTL